MVKVLKRKRHVPDIGEYYSHSKVRLEFLRLNLTNINESNKRK